MTNAWQSYYKRSKELDDKISRKDEEIGMSWFGAGGTYAVNGGAPQLVVSGIYNPAVIARIGVWEMVVLKG